MLVFNRVTLVSLIIIFKMHNLVAMTAMVGGREVTQILREGQKIWVFADGEEVKKPIYLCFLRKLEQQEEDVQSDSNAKIKVSDPDLTAPEEGLCLKEETEEKLEEPKEALKEDSASTAPLEPVAENPRPKRRCPLRTWTESLIKSVDFRNYYLTAKDQQ